ncbi:hypothetical protein SmJEL517_g01555 [Synchytrium microbalum]|uniref:Arf-GAP domain-containing protein n=1 Tax=Synchytrium microbalum TaxID=1806994 RepID=A0A507C9U4_9FUNG|nr:uncharacterized protein SmJEL517_g01555 [Synchytrium microbalum]TPX36372.1 hypothetical protein SmJEL517_g01555 [Synchytrium microbalum]
MSTRNERMGDKAQNDRNNKILQALMQRADNRSCADCKRKDPRWASWNLGIFVCIRCSGIHRSLGTHISKVKSADLDSWTTEQIEASTLHNMARWGNGKANMYWEAQMPAGMTPPEQAIEQWIRGKYERKQYATPGGIPDPDTLPLPEGVAEAKIPAAPKKAVVPVAASTPTTALPQQQSTPADNNLFASFSSVTTQQQPVTSTVDPRAAIMSLYSNNSPTASVPSFAAFGNNNNTTAQASLPKGAEFFGMNTSNQSKSQSNEYAILAAMGGFGGSGTAALNMSSIDGLSNGAPAGLSSNKGTIMTGMSGLSAKSMQTINQDSFGSLTSAAPAPIGNISNNNSLAANSFASLGSFTTMSGVAGVPVTPQGSQIGRSTSVIGGGHSTIYNGLSGATERQASNFGGISELRDSAILQPTIQVGSSTSAPVASLWGEFQ